jgi:hypothetical protein
VLSDSFQCATCIPDSKYKSDMYVGDISLTVKHVKFVKNMDLRVVTTCRLVEG